MEVSLFIDETGTITSAYEGNRFGLGFVFCKSDQIPLIEAKLQSVSLDKIHMRKMLSHNQLEIAKKIKGLNLIENGLSAGSVIQKDPSFGLKAARKVGIQIALLIPDVFIAAIKENNQAKRLKNKLITSIEEYLPKQFGAIRSAEFAVHATRLPVLRVLHAFGHHKPLKIKVHFSAVGDAEKYKESLGIHDRGFVDNMKEYFNSLEGVAFPQNPNEFVEVEFLVESKNDGMYGLSDFFAYIGHKTVKGDKLAEDLYIEVADLFAKGPSHKWEVNKSVFLVKNFTAEK